MRAQGCLTLLLAALMFGSDSWSHESGPTENGHELSKTLGSIFNLTLQNYWIASRWNRPGSANTVEIQTLIPFEVWSRKNLLRLNIPFRTRSELGPGLSDVRIFDLLIFEMGGTDGGFWGVGPAFNLGVNRGTDDSPFQAGAASGLMLPPISNWSLGLLNQNFFSSGVAVSTFQPIAVFKAGKSFSVGLGDLPLVYDWRMNRFAVVSFGLQIGTLIHAGDQAVRFFLNPQFNTQSRTELYKWTVSFGVTLPLSPYKRY